MDPLTRTLLDVLNEPLLTDSKGQLYWLARDGSVRQVVPDPASRGGDFAVQGFGKLRRHRWLLSSHQLLVRGEDDRVYAKPRPRESHFRHRSAYSSCFGVPGDADVIIVGDLGATYIAQFHASEIAETTLELNADVYCGWKADDALHLAGATPRIFDSSPSAPTSFGMAITVDINPERQAQSRLIADLPLSGDVIDKIQAKFFSDAKAVMSRLEAVVDAVPSSGGVWLVCALAPQPAPPSYLSNDTFSRTLLRADHEMFFLLFLGARGILDIRILENVQYVGAVARDDETFCYFLANEAGRRPAGKPWLHTECLSTRTSVWTAQERAVEVAAPYIYDPQLNHDARVGFYGYTAGGPRDATRHFFVQSRNGFDWFSTGDLKGSAYAEAGRAPGS